MNRNLAIAVLSKKFEDALIIIYHRRNGEDAKFFNITGVSDNCDMLTKADNDCE